MRRKLLKGIAIILCCAGGSFSADEISVSLSGCGIDIYDFNGSSDLFAGLLGSPGFDAYGLNFDFNIRQEGGKLIADGAVNGGVSTMYGEADVEASYTIKGTLSSYRDTLRSSLSFSMKGTVDLDGDTYRFSGSAKQNMTLNKANGDMEGTVKGKVSAGGHSLPFSAAITVSGPSGFGIQGTGLDVLVDGDRKLSGTGIISLPSGEVVEFVCSGNANGTSCKIGLKGDPADAFSRGSKLTVMLVNDTIQAVSGKVLGQNCKFKAPKER